MGLLKGVFLNENDDVHFSVTPKRCGDDEKSCVIGLIDIAFLDPPYNKGLLMPALKAVLPLVSDYGFIVCEHPEEVAVEEKVGGFAVWRNYRYGKIYLTVYRKEDRI